MNDDKLKRLIREKNGEKPTLDIDITINRKAITSATAAEVITLAGVSAGYTPHGKQVIRFAESCGCDISPGVMYPVLEELASDGLVVREPTVRTKNYKIKDDELVKERIDEYLETFQSLVSVLETAREQIVNNVDE